MNHQSTAVSYSEADLIVRDIIQIDNDLIAAVKPFSEIFALQECKRIGVRELRLTA
jgi:hypothetical protein